MCKQNGVTNCFYNFQYLFMSLVLKYIFNRKKNREDKDLSPRRDCTLVANPPLTENVEISTIYLSACFLKYFFKNIRNDKALSPRRDNTLVANPPPIENDLSSQLTSALLSSKPDTVFREIQCVPLWPQTS